MCLAQGIPLAVIDNYVFPTTATGGRSSGNPVLDPETADTYNLGLSWTSRSSSPLLGGLSASVDYYKIEISEVISVVPGLSALTKCYNLDGSNPATRSTTSSVSCSTRDSNGLLELIELPYLNLGGLQTEGIDLQLGWSAALEDLGISSGGRVFLNTGIGYLRSMRCRRCRVRRSRNSRGRTRSRRTTPYRTASRS